MVMAYILTLKICYWYHFKILYIIRKQSRLYDTVSFVKTFQMFILGRFSFSMIRFQTFFRWRVPQQNITQLVTIFAQFQSLVMRLYTYFEEKKTTTCI